MTFQSCFPPLRLRQRSSLLRQKFTTKLKKLLTIFQFPTNPVLSFDTNRSVKGVAAVDEDDHPLLRITNGLAETDGTVDGESPVECTNTENSKYEGRRKALLIGVGTPSDPSKTKRKRKRDAVELGAAAGPHRDVDVMTKLLIAKYGYSPQNITALVNDDNDLHAQPTREEIIRQMKTLVKGARSEDRFFFLYAGHGFQERTDNRNEEDGMDELIYTSDGGSIIDDLLKEILVDKLPVGSRLTAIMDCCHSGTSLDLPHYRCNRVYVPWVSKGKRESRSECEEPSRKDEIAHDIPLAEADVGSTLDFPRCDFPSQRYCDGFCRDWPPSPEKVQKTADVVCFSAAKDSQVAWEDAQGGSLTHYLVKTLNENPHPTLARLLDTVSHDIHRYYVNFLHPKARKSQRSIGGIERDAVNFQDPQISSHTPLNMDGIFDP